VAQVVSVARSPTTLLRPTFTKLRSPRITAPYPTHTLSGLFYFFKKNINDKRARKKEVQRNRAKQGKRVRCGGMEVHTSHSLEEQRSLRVGGTCKGRLGVLIEGYMS
jgi:hypothetical protein